MSSSSLPELPRNVRVPETADPSSASMLVFELGVSDGHPIIPPTQSRVDAMLDGVDGTEVLARIAPLNREATVADVEVCAVLAGCPPGALPILCTAVIGAAEPTFNLLGLSTTTGNAAIGLILHGSAATSVGASGAGNCLGPGNLANATIGRAFATVIRSVGCAIPGVSDMAIVGQPAKFGMCFAELDARPYWSGLADDRLGANDGAVTVFGVSGVIEVVDAVSVRIDDLLATVACAIRTHVCLGAGGSVLNGGEHVVVVPPEWVTRIVEADWTKQDTQYYLWESSEVHLDALPPGVAS